VESDAAGNTCQAPPRPAVYMWQRLFAAFPFPSSAARLYQSAAARWSGAAMPFPSSSKIPKHHIAFGNPASAPLVNHPTACSYSSLPW